MGNSSSSQPVTGQNKPRSSTQVGEDLKHLARVKRAEDARKEAIAANIHDNIKENQQLLKKLFKRLDPSVSKVDTDVQGEVQVSLKYDFVSSRLLVNVIKCRDLGLNNITGQTAEPFVELSICPDDGNIGTKRTSASTKSQNPTFNEKFSFPLDEVSLPEQRLILKVMDHDLVSDEVEFLGETVISMSELNFLDSPVHTAWYTLEPETDLGITGELEVELSYMLPQSLQVTIHNATNLKRTRTSNSANAVVKVGIPGIDQVSITQVQHGGTNPSWDETFIFEVPQEELAMRYVVFTVLNQSYFEDALLGHVVVDLVNLDIEHGFRGAFPLSDMSHNDRLRSKWFQTTQVQEFREALWAHSFFRYPNILFQNHHGKKVIRLTCKQAGGAKAKLRLNNGIPVI